MEKSVSSYWLAPGKPQVAVVDSPAAAGKTTPEDFMEFVIEYLQLDPQAFVKAKKYNCKDFISIKHMTRYYLLDAYQLSLNAVGKLTRNADHATVINSREKHNDYMKVHPDYRRLYEPFQKEAMARGFSKHFKHG